MLSSSRAKIHEPLVTDVSPRHHGPSRRQENRETRGHHRPPNRIGADLRRRQDAADPAARHRAQQANRRLHERWVRFDTHRKRTVVANAAIARELAGWCWSLAVLD